MKKFIKTISVLCLCLIIIPIMLCSCEKEHTEHFYVSEWTKNTTHHWHNCLESGCISHSEYGEHDWTSKISGHDIIYTCKVCQESKIESSSCVAKKVADYDDEYHWYNCKFEGCETVFHKEKHTFDGYSNGNSSLLKCDECEKTKTIKLTYIPFVNNTTGFQTSDADTSIAIGLRKGSTLTAQINEYLSSLSSNYKNGLMAKMVALRNNSEATYTIDYDSNYSGTAGVLKVAMECAYDPFNWTQNNADNGAVPINNIVGKYANGYDVQIAAQVAAYLNMKLEIYQYEWDALIPAVQSGCVDVIIAGMSPTEERKEEIDFTVPYYQSNLVIITREGSTIATATTLANIDKAGIKIAAQSGTFLLDALKEQTSNLTVVNSYYDLSDMNDALKRGLIDGYIAEELTALYYC